MNSLRVSTTKLKKRIFFTGVILLVLLSALIIVNITLGFLKDTLRTIGRAYLPQELFVERVLYLPPNFIFLKNISLVENKEAVNRTIFSVPLVLVKFSIIKFIRYGQIEITDICFYEVNTEEEVFRNFLALYGKKVIELLLDLPKKDLRFIVKKFQLKQVSSDNFEIRFYLKLKNDNFYSYGAVSYINSQQRVFLPWEFIAYGRFSDNDFVFDNIEIIRENLYTKLWGNITRGIIRTKGFCFINTLFKEGNYIAPYLSIKERIENFLRGFPPPPKGGLLPVVDLFILDIDSVINIKDFPKIDIDNLSFSINNNPVKFNGSIVSSSEKAIDFNVNLSAQFRRLKDTAQQQLNVKRLETLIQGHYGEKIFSGDILVEFLFLQKNVKTTPLENMKIKLNNVKINGQAFPLLTADISEAQFNILTETNEYFLPLSQLKIKINCAPLKAKIAYFHSRLYDGILYGRNWIDITKAIPEVNTTIRYKDVSSNKLERLVIHFAKVYGKISGQLEFRNVPEQAIKGSFIIRNGYAKDFEFLKWLSSSFSLPLTQVNFERAHSFFKVNSQGAGLHKLNVRSKNIILTGDFWLGNNNLVTSKLSLSIHKDLLQNSNKFKPLLRLVGKEISMLTFDFKLSGELNNINFQWLESDFKQRLRDSIPGFVEKYLERQIEDSLLPLSEIEKTEK
ncbi:MAG: hypothetical protein N2606_06210 [Candidatus Omnitrophica bacterium]|nr:hypothetical protein [Candidatus Omnitrophota bacterium]